MEILDFFYRYFLHFAILYFSFAFLYIFFTNKSSNTNLPPGKKGLPFIGETLSYVLGSRKGLPGKFIADRMSKYSPDVFRTSLLGEDMAVFCGAAGNKFLFSGQNKYVTSWVPYSIKKVLFDPSSFNNLSPENVTKFRSRLSPFVKPESLQHYIPVMDSMAKEHLQEQWSPFKEVKVFPLLKKYTFALACRVFMSIKDPKQVTEFAEPFALITAGMITMPINLPGTAFNRAVKAGKVIRERLHAIIRKRKMELEETRDSGKMDLLTNMFLDGMNEIDITDKILGLLVGSHDTTSIAITFIIKYLAEYPDVYRKVFEEQMVILKTKEPGDLLKWEDIQKMKYSWCVACEVMRLAPPSNGTFREAIIDFTYAGYTIPKGWKAFWNVHTTNKHPKYFPEPEKFDPSRFEGNGPAPYTFVPFGGGPQMCPGKEYARLVILAFIHNVVTKFKWEKVIPNEKIEYTQSPIPVEGLPVSLKHN